MPDLNQQVYDVLSADSALVALVEDRIWNLHRAQEEIVPALVFFRVSTEVADHALGSTVLAGVRYQLDCYASELSQASLVAWAARTALEGAFKSIQVSRVDRYNIDTRDFTVSVDVFVWGDDEN